MVSLKIRCWLPDQEVVVEYPPTIDEEKVAPILVDSVGVTFEATFRIGDKKMSYVDGWALTLWHLKRCKECRALNNLTEEVVEGWMRDLEKQYVLILWKLAELYGKDEVLRHLTTKKNR